MERTYTDEQVGQFLALLDVPAQYRDLAKVEPSMDLLTTLHQHMISTVPFETLDLHYFAEHKIRLDPQDLFRKIVAAGCGRGGYCLENNQLLLYMLRDLGFDVIPAGGKARSRTDGIPQGEYMCWVHIVLIVTLPDNTQWMCDVGFGGDGPTRPISLTEGATIRNLGTQEVRLARDFLPGQKSRNPAHKMWLYQVRNSPDVPWRAFYTFTDAVEWLPPDFALINRFTGVSTDSFAVTTVLLLKFLRRHEGDEGKSDEIYGKRMLVDGIVKENLGGKTTIVEECKTESERVQALRKWFGVVITEEQQAAIKGYMSELKG